ncbi:hypothetical protein AX16_006387 [Volvariella volvacea WC 439]|nr:hypothetical protein AX16_006387 [Volvariella volvacea WC 439]
MVPDANQDEVSTRPHSHLHYHDRQTKAQEIYPDLGADMQDRMAFVTYDHFMNTFAPLPPVPPEKRATFKDFSWLTDDMLKDKEVLWYPELCDTFSSALEGSLYRVFDTANWSESGKDKCIDLSIMPLSERRAVGGSKATSFGRRQQYASYMRWSYVSTFIEVKNENNDHPFAPGKGNNAMFSLGQIVEYASHIQNRQHRTFLFSVSLRGSLAWLIRWDRVGIVVTHSFDYKKEPSKLLDFVYKLGHIDSDMIPLYVQRH